LTQPPGWVFRDLLLATVLRPHLLLKWKERKATFSNQLDLGVQVAPVFEL